MIWNCSVLAWFSLSFFVVGSSLLIFRTSADTHTFRFRRQWARYVCFHSSFFVVFCCFLLGCSRCSCCFLLFFFLRTYLYICIIINLNICKLYCCGAAVVRSLFDVSLCCGYYVMFSFNFVSVFLLVKLYDVKRDGERESKGCTPGFGLSSFLVVCWVKKRARATS